jgi:hypothetical protein
MGQLQWWWCGSWWGTWSFQPVLQWPGPKNIPAIWAEGNLWWSAVGRTFGDLPQLEFAQPWDKWAALLLTKGCCRGTSKNATAGNISASW